MGFDADADDDDDAATDNRLRGRLDLDLDHDLDRHRHRHRTVKTIRYELETLARRHSHLLALGDETATAKKKTKDRKRLLEARHATREFPETETDKVVPEVDGYYLSLFNEFARVVCFASAIPRKELFEAWAMALFVHFYFPPSPEDNEIEFENENENKNSIRPTHYYKRVADMGCGHGLVSWAILFLDKSQTRTAICIDKSIPKSCDIIQRVMMERHPDVVEFQRKSNDIGNGSEGEIEIEEEKKEDAADVDADADVAADVRIAPTLHKRAETEIKTEPNSNRKRWHWVEGDICRNVSADASTLLVGVHCCGTLSDSILDLAISSRSALALVPCCHTRKSLPKEYRNSPPEFHEVLAENARKNDSNRGRGGASASASAEESLNMASRSPPTKTDLLPTTLTDYIDRYRIQKLIDAGFDVREERIPSVITPKNRIIVATPPPPEDVLEVEGNRGSAAKLDDDDDDDDGDGGNGDKNKTIDTHDGVSQPIGTTTHHDAKPKPKRFEKSKRVFRIPLADTPLARSIVASQSGRIAADLRRRQSPPNLSLSLYLPDSETSVTAEQLNELSDTIAKQEQHKHFPEACHDTSTTTPRANNENANANANAMVITTHVEYGSHGAFAQPDRGVSCVSRSYRIRYEVNDPTGRLPQVTKSQAKALHKIVCTSITENAFPGVTLRQGVR